MPTYRPCPACGEGPTLLVSAIEHECLRCGAAWSRVEYLAGGPSLGAMLARQGEPERRHRPRPAGARVWSEAERARFLA